MINPDRKPPFVAYRLTPKRQVASVKIDGTTQLISGDFYAFVTERGNWLQPEKLWSSELEALLHVQEWTELRKATLLAELANLEVAEMKLRRRLRDLGHE